MNCLSTLLPKLLFGIVLINSSVWAEPVWHCSRSDVQIANASDDFTLAALTLDREVIRLSLRDLYNVYQGTAVKLSGGLPLKACISVNDIQLTNEAMQSIGAKNFTSNETNSAKKNRHLIQNEADMLACIAKNHPAIGYLAQANHTEAVGPCF